ncbi:MAG: DUF4870 domain-containing protein [Chloroflexaceae bacterium]|nr:DUF4870 domain-containing protein [Chloroflexaceae bacterium]
MAQTHTEDERLLAALAHAGILLNGFNLLGIVGATLIWFVQRNQSEYIARHALQALAYQVTTLLLLLFSGVLWGGCLLISLLPTFLQPELYRGDPPPTFWIALLLGLTLLTGALALVGYGLVAAWAAWRGQPFSYALIGNVVQRRMAARFPAEHQVPAAINSQPDRPTDVLPTSTPPATTPPEPHQPEPPATD